MTTFQRRFVCGAVVVGALALVAGGAAAFGKGVDPTQLLAQEQARFAQIREEIQARLAGLASVQHQSVCATAEADGVRCHARVVVDAGGSPHVSVAPSGYGPQQFVGAYGLGGVAASNPGPVIGIVDAYDDPRAASDLATYSSTFGIPKLPTCSGSIAASGAPCFQKMGETGSTVFLPRSNSGWDLEISLDIEAAHAACQNCRILLVEANSASYTDLMKAVDTAVAKGAQAVSGSWGSGEFSSESSYDSHFNKSGVAFTFSAGDGGYGASYPASSPYVTAVGGTSLLLNPDGSYLGESAWSGTGSGCSAYEGKPTWQKDPACAKRTVTDVSADADPATGAAVYDSVSYYGRSGWFQVGGTSLSSPLIAATYALRGVPAGTHGNSLPYAQGTGLNLHDVMTGANGSCGGSYLCTAAAGYDGPTGLGTPNGTSAF